VNGVIFRMCEDCKRGWPHVLVPPVSTLCAGCRDLRYQRDRLVRSFERLRVMAGKTDTEIWEASK